MYNFCLSGKGERKKQAGPNVEKKIRQFALLEFDLKVFFGSERLSAEA